MVFFKVYFLSNHCSRKEFLFLFLLEIKFQKWNIACIKFMHKVSLFTIKWQLSIYLQLQLLSWIPTFQNVDVQSLETKKNWRSRSWRSRIWRSRSWKSRAGGLGAGGQGPGYQGAGASGAGGPGAQGSGAGALGLVGGESFRGEPPIAPPPSSRWTHPLFSSEILVKLSSWEARVTSG